MKLLIKCIIFILLIIFFYFIYIKKEDNLETARFYHRKSDGINALKYYHKCIYDKNYFVLIDIAKIYHHGLFNVDKNIYLANKYYISFLNILDILPNSNTIEHRKYKSYVENKLEQIKIENTQKEINNGGKQKQILDNNLNDINEYLTKNIMEGFNKDNLFKNQPVNRVNDRIINTVLNNIPIVRNINQVVDIANIIPTRPQNNLNIVYNEDIYDVQNVHDTSINKTVQHSIENIKRDTVITYNFNEIIDMFNTEVTKLNLSDNKLSNIKKVINHIRQDTTLSIYNHMKSSELIVLVGNRIFNSNDENYKETCINNLALELNDCIENNNVVCHTGVFNRVLNSLNHIDTFVNVKSTNVLNDEMMNKCSLIRSTLDENIDDFDNKLKKKIREELKKDYVDTNIITQEELNNIINVWIDYI